MNILHPYSRATYLVTLAMVASIVAARAEPASIPAAYRGQWCDGILPTTWKRCRIGFWIIREKTIGNEEMHCTVKAAESEGRMLTINAECEHSAEPGKYAQSFRLELSADSKQLTMTDQ